MFNPLIFTLPVTQKSVKVPPYLYVPLLLSRNPLAKAEKPLWTKRVCRFPVKGTVSIVNTNRSFTLDYGDGECNAIATVTDSDGNTKEITLGKRSG